MQPLVSQPWCSTAVRPPRPAAALSPRPSPRPPAQAAMSSAASASPQAQPQHSPASPPAPKGAQPPAPCTPAKTAASSASSSDPSRSVGTLPTGPESGSNVIQCIADRLGERRFPRQFGGALLKPELQRGDQRLRANLPGGLALRGALPPDLRFDFVQCRDPL